MRRKILSLFFLFTLIATFTLPLVNAQGGHVYTVLKSGSFYLVYDRTGALVSNSTDALVAFEYCRDNAPSGGKVFVGEGQFVFSGDYVQTAKILSWEGSGVSTYLSFNGGSGFVINATGSHISVKDFYFYGSNTGSGLTVLASNRVGLYGLTFARHTCGLNLTNVIVVSVYDIRASNCTYGVYVNAVYGLTQFYGGALTSNDYGIYLNSSNGHNQFYGLECEVNWIAEIKFGGSGTNFFTGLYFERTSGTTNNYFEMNPQDYGSNTFIHCKFASQVASNITVEGDSNVFDSCYFDGGVTVSLTLNGDHNRFINNRADQESAKNLLVMDNGEDNLFTTNFFYDNDINNFPPTATSEGQSDQELLVTFVIVLAIVGLLGGALGLRSRV